MVFLGLLVIPTSLVYGQCGGQAKLQVLPDEIDFGEVEAYSTSHATEGITISNCGDPDSVLCWDIRSNDCWICVVGDTTIGEINLFEGDQRYEDVTMCATGLCIDETGREEITGVYNGTFYVYQNLYDCSGTDPICTRTPDPTVDPIEVKATMSITEYNVLEVTPEDLTFGEVDEDAELKIKNAGEGLMRWEALVSAESSWLTVEGGTGTSGSTVTSTTDTITVSVDRSKVEGCAYSHYGNIKITAENAEPDEVLVYVTMNKKIEPPEPCTPAPADGAADQSSYSTLSWQEGESSGDVGGVVYFDVYFSTNQTLVESDSPSVLVCENMDSPYCDPTGGGGQLNPHTTYFWKVKARDECQGEDKYSNNNVAWSFTTGAVPVSTCPVSSILPLNNNKLTTLRRFRDEVLMKSPAGERYVDLYYSFHAVEALLIMMFNPELKMCADMIVNNTLPAIQSRLKGEVVPVDAEIIADMETFFEELGKNASPGLKKVISIMKKDVATGDLLEDFGFSRER